MNIFSYFASFNHSFSGPVWIVGIISACILIFGKLFEHMNDTKFYKKQLNEKNKMLARKKLEKSDTSISTKKAL